MSLGDWITRTKERNGWSWERMASETGVSATTLRHHVSNPGADVEIDTIVTIAENSNLTPWELLEAAGYNMGVFSSQAHPDGMIRAWLLQQSKQPGVAGMVGAEADELVEDIKALVEARLNRRKPRNGMR